MDYNGLYTSILLLKLSDKKYLPLPSLQPSYGPFASMNDAKADLVNTFKDISIVPRGYTFCVIEDGKPQEYWFTQTGNWDSVEPKNTSSSSITEITGIKFRFSNDWLQVSTDNGNTWTNLIPKEELKGEQGNTGLPGPQGEKGDAGNEVRLEDIKLRITTTTREVDGELQYVNLLQISYTGVNGTYYDVGPIIGGNGSGGSGDPISIATYTDGLRYWKQGDQWMTDDHGNMVRAEGIDGQDGEDGTGVFSSFKSIVFKRTNTDISNQRPTGGTFSSPRPTSGGWFDGVPSGPEKLWMSAKWFYSNESMNDDINNPWSYPSQATDTADLDFEYSNAPVGIGTTPPTNPDTNRYNALTNPYGWYDPEEHSELLPQACWMAIRKKKNGEPYGGWQILQIRGESGVDGLSPTAHFKSFSFRRSNNYTEHTEVVNGKNTTVYVLDPSENPSGGDYNSPNPTNVDSGGNLLWSDGIPKGEHKLWESTCIFHSDGTSEGWTTPRAVGDTEYTDEEWAEENPAYPKPQRRSPDDNNPDYPAGRENDGWDDEPIPGKNYVYKAIRPVSNGEYVSGSDWVVIRVAGEKGEDGTSVTIKGTLAAMYSTYDQALADRSHRSNGDLIYVQNDDPSTGGINEIGVYRYNSSTNTYTKLSPEEGDGYLYNGDLWIWVGDSLINVGQIKGDQGEPGTSYFLHIKYSDDSRVLTNPSVATFTASNGEEPGRYIGTYTNTIQSPTDPDSMDITKYKWQEWLGKDGFGYEYIFRLTSKDAVDGDGNPIAPSVPTRVQCISYEQDGRVITFDDDDYVPPFDGWTDDPQSPYKQYPYCWVAYRKKVDGVWRAYVGNSTDNSKAALFSMYTSKGRGIDSITEMYAVGTSGTVAPDLSAFSTTIPAFDPENDLKYLWNYEVISYDDESPDTTYEPACIGVWVAGKGIGKIVEYYYASPVGPKEDGSPASPNAYPVPSALPDAGWSKIATKLKKKTPYLWNYEVVWYDDNTLCNITTPACIAYYTYTDVEYLLNIFKKVEGDSDTAYLGGIIGAIDNNQKIQAMLNATDIGKDDEHGKLYIAAGMNGLDGTDTEKNRKAQNATFKVYEDGHVSMKSAELQGYLTQHFRRVHDVSRYIAEVGNGTQTRYLDKSKLSNALLLGWNTLNFSDAGETVDFRANYQVNLATFLDSDNAGRVIFSNQYYVSKNGTVFSNNNFGKTILDGYFILPNGTITNGSSGIALYGGWVEVIKVSSLDADMSLIVPQLASMDNLYIVTGYGGSVRFTYVDVLPNINENQAVVNNAAVGLNVDYTRNKVTVISADTTIYRLTEFNKKVLVAGNNTASTLYIIVPKLLVDTWYDEGAKDIEYTILLNGNHREVIFKQEIPGSNTSDAEVPNLTGISLINGGTLHINSNGVGSGSYNTGVRLSHFQQSGHTNIDTWLAEIVTPISSL